MRESSAYVSGLFFTPELLTRRGMCYLRKSSPKQVFDEDLFVMYHHLTTLAGSDVFRKKRYSMTYDLTAAMCAVQEILPMGQEREWYLSKAGNGHFGPTRRVASV
jgi:hypothetical protein